MPRRAISADRALGNPPAEQGTDWQVYIAVARVPDMRADRVEVSWDDSKKKWLVRIQAGEEVIRRYCDSPKSVDDPTIRAAAQKTLVDEGYEPESAGIVVKR